MGVKELRDAFNQVSEPAANCALALMEYDRHDGVEYQILYFSGNYADGAEFAIKSNRIRPSGDLIVASRETAQRLLETKRTP